MERWIKISVLLFLLSSSAMRAQSPSGGTSALMQELSKLSAEKTRLENTERVKIAAGKATLAQGLQDLDAERSQIEAEQRAYKQGCVETEVEEGSAAAETCLRTYERLAGLQQAYRRKKDSLENVERSLLQDEARLDKKIAVLDAKRKVAKLRLEIRKDSAAIRRLGFDAREKEFEGWVQLAEEKQKEYDEQYHIVLHDLMMMVAQEGLRNGLLNAGGITPEAGQRMIADLKAAGVGDPLFLQAVEALANIKDKQSQVQHVVRLYDGLRTSRRFVRIGEGAASGSDDALWTAGIQLINWLTPDPRLRTVRLLGTGLLHETRLVFYQVQDNATRRVSSAQVGRLTKLNETQLQNLDALSGLMKKHVRELQEAKQELLAVSK